MNGIKKSIIIFSIMLSVNVMAAKISSIDIKNTNLVSSELIKETIGQKEGQEYKKGMEEEIYKKLLETGLFSDVKIEKKGGFLGSPVKLQIEVFEHDKTAEILAYREEIEKASVRTDLIVNSIKITGNKNIPLTGFIDQANIKVGQYFTPITVRNLVGAIFNTGYFSAVVPQINRSADDKSVDIEIQVVENPTIKSVSLTGTTLFSNEELLEAADLKIGKVLNLKSINNDVSPIIQLYRSKGIMTASFSKADVTADGIVNLEISEGKVSSVKYVKNVELDENERLDEKAYKLKTKPFVLERLTYVKEGDFLTEQALTATMRDLGRTGLFSSIVPAVKQNPNDVNGRDIEFLIEERPSASINGQASYELREGFTGTLSLADKNFLGKQQDVSLQGTVSTKGDYSIQASFFDPWIRNTDRIQIGANVFFKREANKKSALLKDLVYYEEKKENGQTKKEQHILPYQLANYTRISGSYSYGGGVTVGKGFKNDIYLTVNPRIYGIKTLNARGLDKSKDKKKFDTLVDYTLGSVTTALSYDTRDDIVTPKNGFYVTGSYEAGYVFREKTLTPKKLGEIAESIKKVGKEIENDQEVKKAKEELNKNQKDKTKEAQAAYDKAISDAITKKNGSMPTIAPSSNDTLNTRFYNIFKVDARAYHDVIKDKNSMAYRVLFGYASKTTPEDMLFDTSSNGTSLRGYGPTNTPLMLIGVAENRTYINQYLQLVAFAEAGVFSRKIDKEYYNEGSANGLAKYEGFSGLKLKNAQVDAGLGARINTPLGVVRLDYAFPLVNKQNDANGKPKLGRFSFGFGQTF